MKELRAFFEMTGLTLLPLLVLFLALYGPLRHDKEASPTPAAAAPAPLSAAAAVTPSPQPAPTPAPTEPPVPAEEPATAEAPEAEEVEAALSVLAAVTHDGDVTVDILFGSRVETMTLRDYLLGVVAAEMPASFEPAALEAQAVAARTDTFYRLLVARPHADAACCTDPGCCKAYLGPEELKRRWGEDYDRWETKIAAAVDATDGVVLTWEGAPLFAAFHAASAGRTEASENVWVSALPYLRSVPTGETEADVPAFRSAVTFTAEELRSILLEKIPGAELPEDPAEWLREVRYTEAGRVLSLEAGGVAISGSALRRVLGLRSAAVSWKLEEGVFTFEAEGWGHGVGMSQYGAEVMAKEGSGWEEILLHYYPGAELSELGEIFPG